MNRTNARNIVIAIVAVSAVWMIFDHYGRIPGMIGLLSSTALAIAFLRSIPTGKGIRGRVPLLKVNMTPAEFEEAVAQRMRQDGWDANVMGGAGDRGIDVRATNADGAVAVVQCKLYGPNTAVTPTQVRDLAGAKAISGASVASLVTTGTLTEQARLEAREAEIEVIEGESTRRWMSGNSIL